MPSSRAAADMLPEFTTWKESPASFFHKRSPHLFGQQVIRYRHVSCQVPLAVGFFVNLAWTFYEETATWRTTLSAFQHQSLDQATSNPLCLSEVY
jgi:hypothetical protein